MNWLSHISVGTDREGSDFDATSVGLAVMLIRFRQERAKHYPELKFADPAWDIMLDVFVAAARGKHLSVGDLAVGSDLPTSTALRWSDYLVKQGVVDNVDDPNDKRRKLMSMNPAQLSRISALLFKMAGSLAKSAP